MPRLSTFSALLAGLLALAPTAGAAGTPAGTVITNRAVAEALTDAGNTPVRSESNEVRTVVQPVCAVSVTPDGSVAQPGQRATVRSGGAATFAYRVTNSGNAPFTFGLEARREEASTAAVGNLRLHRDLDGNGLLDAGEPEVQALALEAGAGADVLLHAEVPETSKGVAYVSLGARCGDGRGDRENVAELRVEGSPRLVFEKTFGAAQVRPGGEVAVTLRVRNEGNEAATDLTVSDPLNTPALAGLTLVPGSLRATVGQAGPDTDPLRWTLPRLEGGAAAELTFALRVAAGAAVGERVNVATLRDASGQELAARATTAVGAGPALALGPGGNPEATPGGELSASDLQTRGQAVVNQPVCLPQTLRNTGNVADRVTLRASVEAGQADVTFRAGGGSPLAQPVALAVGATLTFEACLTPRAAADVAVRLTAVSSVGAADNSTIDRLSGIDARPLTLGKAVTPEGTVARGTTLTYTLAVTNPYAFPLTNVVVRDRLDDALTFVSADGGGTFAEGTVSWRLGELAPGAARRLTVVARVGTETADGTVVLNRFSLTSDQTPEGQGSNTVVTPVWTAALAIEKTVSAAEVTPGDRLTYRVRLHNTSPVAGLFDVAVTDRLPEGLAYLPGSARLEGEPLADPRVEGQTLTWERLPLPMPANGWLGLTYDVRVLPSASGELVNVVSAKARATLRGRAPLARPQSLTSQNGPQDEEIETVVVVASNVAKVGVRLRPGLFAPESAVIGRVFVDRDRDGMYREGVDTPLERARVILAEGRTALTDAQGRYHFAGVKGPVAALRLDPHSVPYPPLSVPGDGGRPGSRAALLTGLTSVDFPLGALAGEAAVTRSTTLRGGPLALDKTVTRAGDGSYTVRLTLRTTQALADFDLTDPLPAGAALLDGATTLRAVTLAPGETVLTYRFRLAPSPAPSAPDPVTDPAVRWRSQ